MLRRLHPEQPESFAFTPANLDWAKGQIAKYPEGRQASAVIPLLWRAQEQDGWVTERAIETVAEMLGMAKIRVLEVASFYFMFQLKPVGSVAHVQVCGTTSCMICGAEDLIAVCRRKIAPAAHTLSSDGRFSWEEVECLGACSNAPMAQIGKDYYEDLTAERFADILDALARGEVPTPGPQNGRFASEPAEGLTSLNDGEPDYSHNASVTLALDMGDTVKRITGDEPAPRVLMPAGAAGGRMARPSEIRKERADAGAPAASVPEPAAAPDKVGAGSGTRPLALEAPRGGAADDLTRINGVGPVLQGKLNALGFWHFDQIASWTAEEVAWIDQNMVDFKGRASRDEWVRQARELAKSEN
jgi:NADH-quinone oxidoreductase subunit E